MTCVFTKKYIKHLKLIRHLDGFTCRIKTQLPKRKWKTVFLVLLLVSGNLNRIISCSPRRLQNRTLKRDKKSTFCHTPHSKHETRFLHVQKRSLRLGKILSILEHFEQFAYVTTKSDKNTCRATIKNTA